SRVAEAQSVLAPLVETYGVSGAEGPVRETVKRMLPAWAQTETDTAGNLWVRVGKGDPLVVFVAHLDEIGFTVTGIRDDGSLELRTRGGFFGSLWEAQPALVHTERGDVAGVFMPRDSGVTRHTPPPLRVDVGTTSRAATMALGVSPGSTITMPKRYVRLAGTRATGRSFDDRVGSTAQILALRHLDRAALKHQVIFIWSTREEIGLEGAQAAAAALGTTARRVHAIDTFVSADSPLELPNFAVAPLGQGAVAREIASTGGTAETLRQAGVPVLAVEQVTGSPEMMDGRVKTLHPKVHGGLLARRAHPGDRAALQQHGITPIDLVAVNLYPFRETVAKPNVAFEYAIEQIDIGGPSMLRSAAKNQPDVLVVVDPADYPVVIAAVKQRGLTPGASPGLRRDLAAKVLAHTAAYDAAIHGYLTKDAPGWPERITLALERRQELRYGENPHQAATLYATAEPGIRDLEQLSGKELSFNNLLDLDAGLLAVAPWSAGGADRAACAIIKHTTPCGIALGRAPREAYERALATDRTSAFGSVIAFNVAVDRAAAEAMRERFVEVV